MTSEKVVPLRPEPGEPGGRAERLHALLCALAVADHWTGTQQELAARLGCSPKTVERATAELRRTRKIVTARDGNALTYVLVARLSDPTRGSDTPLSEPTRPLSEPTRPLSAPVAIGARGPLSSSSSSPAPTPPTPDTRGSDTPILSDPTPAPTAAARLLALGVEPTVALLDAIAALTPAERAVAFDQARLWPARRPNPRWMAAIVRSAPALAAARELADDAPWDPPAAAPCEPAPAVTDVQDGPTPAWGLWALGRVLARHLAASVVRRLG